MYDDDQITKETVDKAIRMVDNPLEWLNCYAIEKQLARALELYKDRGQFNGTFKSAIKCLKRSKFDISYV